ncbi:hypothetical protein BOX15_Mlig019356g1 [Macrostomum lignano]|uniref:Ion transport domain-containing protein n=2 Tax=Macrostomum lignano TaxID=282301 RepID=A0A267H966_9PLAT|nr:hypothetical protein BOX15_Mlig019356g1 [Macrostomum lignano]
MNYKNPSAGESMQPALPPKDSKEAGQDVQQEDLDKMGGDAKPQLVRFLSSDSHPDAETQRTHRSKGHHATFQELLDATKEGRTAELLSLLGPPPTSASDASLTPASTAATGVSSGGPTGRHALIDKRDAEGFTLLHYAARNNHSDICELLLKRGARVDAENADFMTPLHLAAKYRRTRTKAALASESLTSEQEAGPLELHASDENDAVSCLLKVGADFTKRDFYGCTPLHYAAMNGNLVAARLLLNFELNQRKDSPVRRGGSAYASSLPIWRITDNEDMTPLHLACAHRKADAVRLLLQASASAESELGRRDYLDLGETSGQTALHLACSESDADICGQLLAAAEAAGEGFLKRFVNKKDVEHVTCLHCAVEHGAVDVVEMLLQKGAFVNATNTAEQTPLHLAARTGNIRLVELLVQHGAKLDAVDATRQTVLHKAAFFAQPSLLANLLERPEMARRSSIDCRDREGNTPLMLASTEKDDPECARLLLAKGASPLCTDGQGRTAVYLATHWYNRQVLQALLDHPAVREARIIDESDAANNSPLHVACKNGHVDIVELLLENGADAEAKNEDEETPMHLAAQAGHLQVVRRLLKINLSLAFDEDEDSNTPMHLAALTGQARICQLLIEEGKADVNARNSRGWTALDCAASKGFTKVARTLLENDSPTDPVDKSNVTPLFLACQGGHVDMVRLLLRRGARVATRIKYSNPDSPLHNCNCLDAAIDNGHKKVALTLLSSSQWKEALRNETIGEKGQKDTPLRKLIRKMPTIAERVFDKCVEINKERRAPEDPDYRVAFNYEFLDDSYIRWSGTRGGVGGGCGSKSDDSGSEGASDHSECSGSDIYDSSGRLKDSANVAATGGGAVRDSLKNHPLMVMVKTKREDLLLHPLVAALLRHKWTAFGRWVYYLNLLLYAVFLTAFTVYMLCTPPTYRFYGPYYPEYNVTPRAADECQQVQRANPGFRQHEAPAVAVWLIVPLGILFLLKEVGQVFMNRLKYLNFENLMDWSIFTLAIVTVIDFNECQRVTGIRTYWQWNVGAIGILVAWLNLVLFIRKMPRFGIYVVMFTDVFATFSRFFLVFFLFVVSFSLTFFVLLQNQIAFSSMAKTLLKTSVMMIGEFEYTSIFDEQFNPENLYSPDSQVFYDASSYLVFAFFMVVMSIIIMNLLVGLAVDDIKAVQEQASLKRLAMQVELALDVESVLPAKISRRFVLRSEDYYPNPHRTCQLGFINRLLYRKWMSREELNAALNPELDEWERIYQKQDEMEISIASMKTKMKDFRATTYRIEAMLTAVVHKLGINQELAHSLNNDPGDDSADDREMEKLLVEL